jgi:hypothetical protein
VVKVIELRYGLNYSLIMTPAGIDKFLSIQKEKIELKKPAQVKTVRLVLVEGWYVKNLNVENTVQNVYLLDSQILLFM